MRDFATVEQTGQLPDAWEAREVSHRTVDDHTTEIRVRLPNEDSHRLDRHACVEAIVQELERLKAPANADTGPA